MYGGVGPVVMRLPRTEEHLVGQPATLETFERAGQIARSEIAPISDVRGSKDYRLRLANNILQKYWHDVFGDAAPRAHATASTASPSA